MIVLVFHHHITLNSVVNSKHADDAIGFMFDYRAVRVTEEGGGRGALVSIGKPDCSARLLIGQL